MTDYRDISTLHNWEHNPRSMTKDGLERLVKQIKKLGVYKPLLITQDGTVLGGNMRLQALRELGQKEVWVSVVEADTEEKKIEYALSDNDRAGKYEADQLANLIGNFPDVEWNDFTVDIKDPELVTDLMDKFSETEEDEAPPLQEGEAESKLGEVYQLGRHRLMCGDSTDAGSVAILMNGQKADMVFTSPPYNANAKTGEGDIFNKKGSKNMYEGKYKDDMSSDEYVDLAKKVLKICFENTDGFIFWNVSYNANSRYEYIKQIEDYLDYLIEQICWKKTSAIPLKGSLRRAWEPIYLFSTYKNTLGTDKVESNLWEISNTNSQIENHKACFPVALPAKGISLVPNAQIVLDTFGGSGSTLIACEQTNRICYMMELDPKYCDVIRKRYAKFTGKESEWLEITPAENSKNAA